MKTEEIARVPRTIEWSRLINRASGQYYLFSLLLLAIVVVINAQLQENFFTPRAMNGLLRTVLPSLLLAVGQAIVVIGGGIDLSVGAIVTMVNVILVTQMGADATAAEVWRAVAIGLLAGIAAGAVNGAAVAFLRFQPLVTTFATTSIFSGIAVWVLPSPGGAVPSAFMSIYRWDLAGIILPVWIILFLLLAWTFVRNTKFGRFLYASGGQPISAYMSAVPVNWIRFTTYVISGFMSALTGLAITMSIGTGSALIGLDMTMSSIVAVVLGGTALSGGMGGVFGTMIGVFIITIIRNVISFANVPSWYQVLVNGLIVMFALAGPGLIDLIRRRRV
ncbi:MAG TPA: ABC transporter permease [Chloroflexi bacterium]|nr:ABC transporter permease [Chloroflexota bacterium]HPO59669.1 ABC transporter permease [Anaerolineaceae bacterium]